MRGMRSILYAATLAIMSAVIIGLSYLMPAWLAALLVGAVVGIAGYMMISSGLADLRSAKLTPEKTVESIKEDARWLKNQVS